MIMRSRYLDWLIAQGVPVFRGRDTNWELYKRALVPAVVGPSFPIISTQEANSLLHESGALFLRYSSDPTETETSWWYVICDKYDPASLSKRTRNRISKSKSECTVRQIEPDWLAHRGYDCYAAAFGRYKHAVPVTRDAFRKGVLAAKSGPIEFWGVFSNDTLAGYSQCVVDETNVGTSVIKFDPDYLDHLTAFALTSRLVEHYVGDQGKTISNGNRSVVHDTNFQDFLLRLGFRRQFCRLNVVYQPWLKLAVHSVFPLRRLVDRVGSQSRLHQLRALLSQEELNRLQNGRQ